jgi:ligand-binding SRPBCC domain-containing protein
MSTITRVYRSRIPAPPADVLAWHGNPCVFERLTPPWKNVRVVEAQDTIAPGDRKHLRVSMAGPLEFSWKLVHGEIPNQTGFADIQEEGPFRSWRHEHRFLPDGDSDTMLEDRLTYDLPFGTAGRLLGGKRIESELDRLFRFRHLRTQIDLSRHSCVTATRPLRIAVTGSTGLVGRRLVTFLRSGGHEVRRLVRHPARANDEVFWDPEGSRIDAASLEGLDAVIHLAGVSIAGGRWTRSRKVAILSSRLNGMHLLAKTLAHLSQPPRVFVSTSAVGYYGSATSEVLTENSAPGTGFLAEVCKGWEAAAQPASAAGIRVVHP